MAGLKLKALPNFPSKVFASSPITLDRSDGNFTFGLDSTALRTTLDPFYAASTLGDYLESVVAIGAAVPLVTGTGKDVTTLALPVGDWDVELIPSFTGGVTTQVAYLAASISLVANTLDQTLGRGMSFSFSSAVVFGLTPNSIVGFPGTIVRINALVPTTVRFVAQSIFGIAACSAFGVLRARRAH